MNDLQHLQKTIQQQQQDIERLEAIVEAMLDKLGITISFWRVSEHRIPQNSP